jgi:Ca2+-binding RTX toxin-like protein
LDSSLSHTGSTQATYVVTTDTQDDDIKCTVTATNSSGSTSATSDAISPGQTSAPPTGATAPTNTVPPSIFGTAAAGQTLTCSPGTWTGSPTFGYQWLDDGVVIAGATGSTYVVQASNVDDNLSCRVTATNALGTATATSKEVEPGSTILPPVTPVPPVTPGAPGSPTNAALPVVGGTPLLGSPLMCSNGGWSGSPTSFVYQWLRSGIPIANATGRGYLVTTADQGVSLSCSVTASNGIGSSTATSTPVTVGLVGRISVRRSIAGTPRADRLTGSSGSDTINGGAGADLILGGAGNDSLDGGPGNDTIYGGPGNDLVVGGAGNDRLIGGPGTDTISGGGGDDSILGADGKRDAISCGAGRDRVIADRVDLVARDCEHVTRRTLNAK